MSGALKEYGLERCNADGLMHIMTQDRDWLVPPYKAAQLIEPGRCVVLSGFKETMADLGRNAIYWYLEQKTVIHDVQVLAKFNSYIGPSCEDFLSIRVDEFLPMWWFHRWFCVDKGRSVTYRKLIATLTHVRGESAYGNLRNVVVCHPDNVPKSPTFKPYAYPGSKDYSKLHAKRKSYSEAQLAGMLGAARDVATFAELLTGHDHVANIVTDTYNGEYDIYAASKTNDAKNPWYLP